MQKSISRIIYMRTITIKALMIPVITCLLLFAGCGQGGSTATADNSDKASKSDRLIAPCSLLTRAEAEEIMGEKLKEPEPKDPRNPLGQKICFFPAAAEASFIYLQVSLVQTAAMSPGIKSSGMNAEKIYRQTKENLTDIKELEGIGDEAFWGSLGLHILAGDAYWVIGVGSSSDPANIEKAQKIAALILKRAGQ